MEQNEKGLQEKLINWNSINDHPPLSEIEALRMISELNEQDDHELKEALYRLIAYHRLVRLKKQDLVTKQLLDLSGDNHPIVKEMDRFTLYHEFIQAFAHTEVDTWSIRETDFDPAKLKKSQELQQQLKQALTGFPEKITDKDKLGSLYQQCQEQIADLLELLQQTIQTIENRKTGSPVSALNSTIKQLQQLLSELNEALPDLYKDGQQRSPLEELNQLIGLQDVKQYIHQYYHYLKYQQERKQYGFQMVDEPGLHMVITGNPGTGKTTIARLLARLYKDLGILDSDHVIEVNRSHLVGSYVGQSEENTMNYVRQAVGGVLFIDEAYSLRREGQTGNDYGQAVIDTLVSAMTGSDYGGKFAVILAGYPEETRQFLFSNPGLRSRIPDQNYLQLPDFNNQELLEIAEHTALQNDFFFTSDALHELENLIEMSRVDDTFGNARTIKDIVLKIIFQKGADKELFAASWIDHMRITAKDARVEEKNRTKGEPLTELSALIGLDNIKKEVRKLSSFVRVQQERKQKGLPTVPIQLHAVFSGNPGTGKTTVAKLYSQILKECGLLKRGHLVIASRSDLVAGYIGQTSGKTKRKIREALGGVLFIDEAYSLFRGSKDFGKEAIDTLVDEMTKHNENLVVVLAGYQQEMQRFIDSNPGLASRFKKYLHFADYNGEELQDILQKRMEDYQYQASDEALQFAEEKLSSQSVDGNARFITNLLDEAIQFQALRLMDEEVSEENVSLLSKIDIEQAWNTVRRTEA